MNLVSRVFTLTQGRLNAFFAINSERAYQDAGLGNARRHAHSPQQMQPGEIILCMEKCLQDARTAWYSPGGGVACLEDIRKVTALGVQAMEVFGAPLRKNFNGDGEQLYATFQDAPQFVGESSGNANACEQDEGA